MHCEMGSIAARTQSASPFSPAAGPRATPAGVPPPPRVFSRPRQLANAPRPPPPCSLPDDRPRQRSAPMTHRELASVPGHHCPRTRAAPRSSSLLLAPPRSSSHSSAPALAPQPSISLGQLAHPRTPSISPRSALAVGARRRPATPRAHAHACPLWPSLRRRPGPPRGVRGWGGRGQRFPPSSGVAVEPRPPPRSPVTLPHAGRLIASLIDSPALAGPPSRAQTLPCPKMIPRGRASHRMWAACSGASISRRQLAAGLGARSWAPAPPRVHAWRHRGFLPSDAPGVGPSPRRGFGSFPRRQVPRPSPSPTGSRSWTRRGPPERWEIPLSAGVRPRLFAALPSSRPGSDRGRC